MAWGRGDRRLGGRGGRWQEQAQELRNSIEVPRGGVAHQSSAFHGSVNRPVRNDGEGGLSVIGVDGSWFRKEDRALVDVEVALVEPGDSR
jgi:hypothetical protein